MRTILLLMIALSLAEAAIADGSPSLKATLQAMEARDQDGRNRLIAKSERDGLPLNAPQYADQRKRQIAIDRRNQVQLDAIVRQYGWPGTLLVGAEGADAAFRIVLHAGLDYQKKYLPLIREAVANHQADGAHLAILEERVRARDQLKSAAR
jgi:hypothetical protein